MNNFGGPIFPELLQGFPQNNNQTQFKLEDEKSLFSVIGAGTIRSNSKYKVVLALHRAEKPCTFKITLKGTLYEDSETIELQPYSSKNLEFDVPKLRAGIHEIKVEGLSGISYKNVYELNILEERPLILIQTDKATYKPGDLVQFRTLFLDDRTCPYALEEAVTIFIIDAEGNRLKQWKDIKLTKGVFIGKYQLCEEPVLGTWKIDIFNGGGSVEIKTFEVDKYVLPKFNVQIETAKHVAIADGIINVTVRSKYNYGKNVKGKATITLNYGANSFTIQQTCAVKTIEIDGKGEAVFKLADDLNIQRNSEVSTELEILAAMEEELTNNIQEARETVHVHTSRYKIEFMDENNMYELGKPRAIKVAVKHVDDRPVIDFKNSVTLLIEKQQNISDVFANQSETLSFKEKEKVAELSTNLNEQGIAVFQYTFNEEGVSSYNLKVTYRECTASTYVLSKKGIEFQDSKELLQLTALTKSPQLGEKIKILIESCEAIPYFIYTIVGRGKILKSALIKPTEVTKEYTLELEITFDMIPRVVIFVHFVADNKLRFIEQNIFIQNGFQNKISINAPVETKPGENIALEIETTSNSYVGLLGVDQSVLLLRTGNDLAQQAIFDKLNYFTSKLNKKHSNFGERYPGELSGLIMLSNLWVPTPKPSQILYCAAAGAAFGSSGGVRCLRRYKHQDQIESQSLKLSLNHQKELPAVRKEFLENWIFEDIESTDNGIIRLYKRIPDTITSWVITGFSLNPQIGLALTKNPTLIKTFRAFFIDTHLPYAVKKDETISIPVLIFNYMDYELNAEITLDNTDNEFEFLEPGNDQTKRIKLLKVQANNCQSINFKISPKIIGQITLKIMAKSSLAGDAIHKQLKVEAEGIKIYKNHEFFLNAESSGELDFEKNIKLEIPANAVTNSEFIEISLMGNILGTTISNMDKLVRMPCGCGEQNMINFVPNILVLWYLESINELSSSIECKAKRFVELGYQRELNYKHNDGSYSAFGKSDNSGSTWLTAYVMRSFQQAKKYIDINTKLLEDGLDFLANTQQSNGSFKEVGRVIDFEHMNELGLTAFVLLAFNENQMKFEKKYETVIERGYKYLEHNILNTNDLYVLSITIYTLQQRKLPIVHELLKKLDNFAHIEGGHKWWSKGPKDSNHKELHHTMSHDIEITGYILMTLLDMNVNVLPIIKWLISQRNSNGGFDATQDTVVGLWALIKFAQKCGAVVPNMSVEVNSDTVSTSRKLHVDIDNALIVQKLELPKPTREITFHSNGVGCAIFQLAYHYNILENETKKSSFKLNSKVTKSEKMCLQVTAEFTPLLGEEFSNMVVMEIALPSGYTALSECFNKIQKDENLKRVETKHEKTLIVVYFDCLKAAVPKNIFIEAENSYEICGQKPTSITIYDYYDNQKRAVEFYQI